MQFANYLLRYACFMYLPCILILFFLFLIADAPFPLKMDLIFIYSAFIKGDHTYFEIDPLIEGTQLYPHVNYTTVSKYLDTLV
jgi:hypothetical protein